MERGDPCFSALYLDRRLIPGTFAERLSIKVARSRVPSLFEREKRKEVSREGGLDRMETDVNISTSMGQFLPATGGHNQNGQNESIYII